MDPLTNADEVLLSAMIATVGVVWAIGFAAYTFIANYFFAKPKEERTRERLWLNLIVYSLYFVMGLLAFRSILESSNVLMSGDRAGLPSAWTYFLVAVGGHVVLFSLEIGTSIRAVVFIMFAKRKGAL